MFYVPRPSKILVPGLRALSPRASGSSLTFGLYAMSRLRSFSRNFYCLTRRAAAGIFALLFVWTAVGAAVPAEPAACFGMVPANTKVSPVRTGGIPFLRFAPTKLAEGKSLELPLPGVAVGRLYLLGMINSPDLLHPAWGGGD